jgi:hypothetical protein
MVVRIRRGDGGGSGSSSSDFHGNERDTAEVEVLVVTAV